MKVSCPLAVAPCSSDELSGCLGMSSANYFQHLLSFNSRLLSGLHRARVYLIFCDISMEVLSRISLVFTSRHHVWALGSLGVPTQTRHFGKSACYFKGLTVTIVTGSKIVTSINGSKQYRK